MTDVIKDLFINSAELWIKEKWAEYCLYMPALNKHMISTVFSLSF